MQPLQRSRRPWGSWLLALAAAALTSCTAVKKCAYEGRGRDLWQEPGRVVESLGLEPGQVVADLGAGSGYFTGRLARAVAPGGRVLAVDVDAAMNRVLEERLTEEGVTNVDVILAEPDDAGLPEAGVDLVFTANTYHHIEERPAYFARLGRALRPSGRVAVVEYDGSEGFFQALFPHYTAPDEIRAEMEQAGYELVESLDFLDRQSFQIFAVPAPRAP
ncbi:MAG: class I SAM-dependent methyltransferase [Myxococcota bacterium]|nr:class I SAM-dependent methyltransferase [Myxococcota bacterium]